MSEAGAAAFNSTVTATGFIIGSASIDETELEILDGATLSTTELNYVDGVTSAIQTQLDAKQATLTFGIANTNVPKFTSGVVDDDFLRIAGTTVEGRSASEVLSDIGGITASSSDTLTNKSIDSDNNTITNIVNADIKSSAAIVFSKMENLTASRALVSDGSGDVSAATTTSTEIGYVNGVTSAIQTQLDAKASKGLAVAMAIAV